MVQRPRPKRVRSELELSVVEGPREHYAHIKSQGIPCGSSLTRGEAVETIEWLKRFVAWKDSQA